MHFEYPPAYPLFLRIIFNIFGANLYVAVFLQVIILACTAAIFITSAVPFSRQIIATIVISLDPVSSSFVFSILTESLFLSAFFIWVLCFRWYNSDKNTKSTFILGVATAGLYVVKFSGIFWVIPILGSLAFNDYPVIRKAKTLFLFGCGFFSVLLPWVLKYKSALGTSQINSYTNLALWNNATVLNPKTMEYYDPDFKNFIIDRPDSLFTTSNAVSGWHIGSLESPLREYIAEKKIPFEKVPQFSKILANAAGRAIFDDPLNYLKKFVIPNINHRFTKNEIVRICDKEEYFRDTFNFALPCETTVNSVLWAYLFILILIISIISFSGIYRIIPLTMLIYSLALPFLTPLAIRYFSVNFSILAAMFFIVEIPLFRKTTAKHTDL